METKKSHTHENIHIIFFMFKKKAHLQIARTQAQDLTMYKFGPCMCSENSKHNTMKLYNYTMR